MGFHGLVNTVLFSQTARDFIRNGQQYTTAPRGSRDYHDFWEEEERRCLQGYMIGDTYITGRHYFYLNFCPIWRVPDANILQVQKAALAGKNINFTAERELTFPRFYEIDYEWFNFKHIAWFGGNFMGINSPGGRHICCLKSRGAGFSYKEAADGVYNYYFIEGSKSYYFSGLEEYLVKDGILNKVQEMLDHINTHSPYWKLNRGKKNTLMHQKASYLDEMGNEIAIGSEIIGTVVDNPNKAHPYSTNIFTPDGYRKWADVQTGEMVFGSNGKPIKVLGTYEQGEQDIYTVTFDDGRQVQCTKDHLWTVSHWSNKQRKGIITRELITRTLPLYTIAQHIDNKSSDTNRIKVQLNGPIEYKPSPVPIEAYTMGLMLGDGAIGNSTKNISYLTMLYDDVEAIKPYIPYEVVKENWGTGIRNKIMIPNGRQIFENLDLFDKRSGTKFIPDIYKYNSIAVRKAVLNGLLDTDGSITRDFGVIEFCSKSCQLADDTLWIARSLGYGGTKKFKVINGTKYYRVYIYCNSSELTLFNLPRKRERVCIKKTNKKALHISQYVNIKSVEFSHRELAKCIRVDAEDSLYLVEDHIVTHNTRGKRGRKIVFEEAGSFKNLKQALEICQGSIKDGSIYVGQISLFGTGGEEGPAIEGLTEVYENPGSWDMLEFPNVFDEGMEATTCGYFVPCTRANVAAMDEEGNVNIEVAVRLDNIERAKKAKSKDPRALDRRKAEYPRNATEALMRMSFNMYNISEIDAQIKRILSDRAIQGYLRNGTLIQGEKGPEFVILPHANPILHYPHKNSDDLDGCLTVFERPVTIPYIAEDGERKNGTPPDIYFITVDPVYKEDAEDLTSLFDIRVWKQYNTLDPANQGLPVAWWTGRPKQLEVAYKMLFMMAEWYNCTIQSEVAGGGQGIIDYARRHKLLHKLEYEISIDNKEISLNDTRKNRSYFMNMTNDIKMVGLRYHADWTMEVRGANEFGQAILNMHRIYDLGLLREMRKYNDKRNADRISSSIIGMYMLKKKALEVALAEDNESNKNFYNRQMFAESPRSGRALGTTTAY